MDSLVITITECLWYAAIRISGSISEMKAIRPRWRLIHSGCEVLDPLGDEDDQGLEITLLDLRLVGSPSAKLLVERLPEGVTMESLVRSAIEYFLREAGVSSQDVALVLVMPDVQTLRDSWLHKVAESMGFPEDSVFVLWPGLCAAGHWLKSERQRFTAGEVDTIGREATTRERHLNFVYINEDYEIRESWMQDYLLARCDKHSLAATDSEQLPVWAELLYRGEGVSLDQLLRASQSFCEGVVVDGFVTYVWSRFDEKVKQLCDPFLYPGSMILQPPIHEAALDGADFVLMSEITVTLDLSLSSSRKSVVYTTLPNRRLQINDDVFLVPYSFLRIEQYKDGCLKSIHGSISPPGDYANTASDFCSSASALTSASSTWEPTLIFRHSPRYRDRDAETTRHDSTRSSRHNKENAVSRSIDILRSRLMSQISRVQSLLSLYAAEVVLQQLRPTETELLQDIEITDEILSKLEFNLVRSVAGINFPHLPC
eukprot:Gregarina_sp_Poly_1__6179@NODE_326_length_9503_cov_249_815388_g278_i0_p3_GENE_NODE_326_length_9503_cov_249_815388_g278_i0NODE_326_length_9503_cov_249_815388_g278_i0_p3_ORF_typecomplete_len486_score59_65_NODE_326_length_9503_cov_249_815388_g278_i05962053